MPRLAQLTFQRILGAGNFGEVSLYLNEQDGQQYAVKKFMSRRYRENEFYSTANSELRNFNHFIQKMGIPVHDAFIDNDQLILPFFTGEKPSWEEIQTYLTVMYAQGFVMGDPKPDNFMHTQYGLMPIDFGGVFDIDDEQFQKDPLARNFVVNALSRYHEAFTGTDLFNAYYNLSCAMDFDSEEQEEEEAIALANEFDLPGEINTRQDTTQPLLSAFELPDNVVIPQKSASPKVSASILSFWHHAKEQDKPTQQVKSACCTVL
ncbi:protein kinase family protein [Legionella feeleii]|uniref:Protein kinase domain n=1 Tax=Legionella feeleii TaxID=453 RepID=A0A378IZ74_9GAMM|nr:protein kinase family protein [Legionella feeleii]STX39781.1 Protein kinase domain [Legionella feeleii]